MKSDAQNVPTQNVPKQAKAKRDYIINQQNFNQSYK